MATPTENDVLLGVLRAQRRHVVAAVDGLDDEAMRRPVLPSGWSCVELVHHLTHDDERFWTRAVIAGDRAVIAGLDDTGWTVPDGCSVGDVLAAYADAAAASDDTVAAADLDAPPAWWPDFFPPEFRLDTVREVVLHLVTETAAHAGHLDAVRELLDGRQWLVVT